MKLNDADDDNADNDAYSIKRSGATAVPPTIQTRTSVTIQGNSCVHLREKSGREKFSTPCWLAGFLAGTYENKIQIEMGLKQGLIDELGLNTRICLWTHNTSGTGVDIQY